MAAQSSTTTGAAGRRRRPAEVRSLLLDAAATRFARDGYAQTTKKDVAERAGVALSVLDRHFESKAVLFAEAVLEPFVEFLDRMKADWLKQRDVPISDEPLMHMVLGDLHHSLRAHRHALDGLVLARDDLGEEIVARLRDSLDQMFDQLRLMGELEAERRGWFSAEGLDLTLRVLVGMVMGITAYDWVLLPDTAPDSDALVDEMSRLGLWGLERRPR